MIPKSNLSTVCFLVALLPFFRPVPCFGQASPERKSPLQRWIDAPPDRSRQEAEHDKNSERIAEQQKDATETQAYAIVGATVILAVVALVVLLRKRATPAPVKASAPEPTAPAGAKLIACPDCGRHVSRMAPSCPQCGRPLAPEKTE